MPFFQLNPKVYRGVLLVYQMSMILDDVFQIFQQSFPALKLVPAFNSHYYESEIHRLQLEKMDDGTVAFYWHHVPSSTAYNGTVETPEDVRAEIDNGSEVFAKRDYLLSLARGKLGAQVTVAFDNRTTTIRSLTVRDSQAIDNILGVA